jgi:hypothetical protein
MPDRITNDEIRNTYQKIIKERASPRFLLTQQGTRGLVIGGLPPKTTLSTRCNQHPGQGSRLISEVPAALDLSDRARHRMLRETGDQAALWGAYSVMVSNADLEA